MGKKLWQLLVCFALVLAMAFCFAACGGGSTDDGSGDTDHVGDNSDDNKDDNNDKEEQKTALSVPTGVKVEDDRLIWNAVENAAGYTVKINADETTKVTVASLDLTTVTEKLTEGNNSLSVKATGTGNYTDSAYSQAVTYVYTAPETVSEAVKAFTDKVNGIGTLAQSNTQAEAAAISAAISEAETAYAALSGEDQTAAATAKASLDAKKQAYTEQMEGASIAHSAFAAYLLAAEEEMEKEASAATLAEKIEAVKTAKGELSTLAGGLVTDEETGKITALETTLSAWKTNIQTAVTALSAETTQLGDDASAEAILKEVAPILAAYEGYEDYVKADGAVAEKLAAVNAAKKAAEDRLNASVKTLKDEIDAALQNKEATRENYDALKVLQARAAALGDYAKGQFGDYKKSDIESAIETMLETAADTKEYVNILINQDANSAKVVILRMFVNVLGDMVKFSEDPEVTATAAVGEGEPAPVEATVSYSEEKGVYVVTLPFTKPTTDAVTLSYQIGEEEQVTMKIGKNSFIRYFPENTQNAAYKDDGKIDLTGGSGDTHYVDIYRADDVDAGESRTADVNLKDFPLFSRVSEKDVNTLQKLKGYLARSGYLGEMNVRLVAYDKVEEDGVITVSGINNASVSAPVSIEIIEDDARLDVFHLPNSTSEFAWELKDGENDRIKYAWEIHDGDFWTGIDIIAYATDGIENIQGHDFMTDTPFAVYHASDKGFITWNKIDEEIQKAWKNIPSADRKIEYTLVFAIRLQPNEEAERLGYLPSLLNYASEDGQRQTKDYNFVQQIKNTPADTGVWDAGNGHDFTLVGAPNENFLAQFNGLIDGYELTAENISDYLEILIEVVLDDAQDEVAFSKVVPFQTRAYGFDRLTSEWEEQYFADGTAEDNAVLQFKIYYTVRVKAKVGDTESDNLLASYFTPTDRYLINETSNDDLNCRTYTMTKSEQATVNASETVARKNTLDSL